MAITPETLHAAEQVKTTVRRLTDETELDLVRAWVDAWETLEPEYRALADTLASRIETGTPVTRAEVARLDRLQAALGQTQETLTALTSQASAATVDALPALVEVAEGSLATVLATQLPRRLRRTPDPLDIEAINPGAVDAIVARTSEQIHSRYRPLPAETVTVMRQQLVSGVTTGTHPRTVARRILQKAEQGFNGGLARATNITRTEMLDAYRYAAQEKAIANQHLIAGRRWLATLDDRTCPSCLANHGRVDPPDAFGPADHPSGRCTYVEELRPWRDLGIDLDGTPEPVAHWQDRDEWWQSLDEKTQRRILGPARFELLASGRIGWADLTTLATSDGWRDSWRTPTVAALTLGLDHRS
ncbi:phage minor head protein [Pseudoglutamicibacter cumminsii]|uniref:phage minor head protein n=1 Tax=Pseudoglutamicibacter cumminsii TaxID=156979 RepID=UPI001958C596|nr:SPP1 gp7 family putative phage head morphogenesis protein [Pseudoglutamicibacter cumminsii]